MATNQNDTAKRDDNRNDDEFAEYLKKATGSDGFDVGPYPGLRIPGGIVPFKLEDISGDSMAEMNNLCKEALQKYNAKENTNYEFVKLVKVNGQSVAGRMYYFTFEAKDMGTDESLITFEAKVFVELFDEGTEFLLCRIKT